MKELDEVFSRFDIVHEYDRGNAALTASCGKKNPGNA